MEPADALSAKYESIRPYLNERQWRLLLAADARSFGRGGVTLVSKASGVPRATIHIGLNELANPPNEIDPTVARSPGAGRKKLRDTNPTLVKDLLNLVDPATRGDPMSPLLYTTKSTRQLAKALKEMGHQVSHDVVANLLHEEGFRLQVNFKTREGSQNPDRNAQFEYLNQQVSQFLEADDPVISVDTKKKELVGDFHKAGQQWLPKGNPIEVNVHDFPSQATGKAIPYGVYDLKRNVGWVNVGIDCDTSTFAVESIRRWWSNDGKLAYPNAKRLMITADGGGSNSYRNRLWKKELCAFAVESKLEIVVCHLPPGTSKWNKIEHRLFSYITMNWRGQPLTSHEIILGLIRSTTTTTGLRVEAALDTGVYEKSIKIDDEEMRALPIQHHEFLGTWNYTVNGHAYESR